MRNPPHQLLTASEAHGAATDLDWVMCWARVHRRRLVEVLRARDENAPRPMNALDYALGGLPQREPENWPIETEVDSLLLRSAQCHVEPVPPHCRSERDEADPWHPSKRGPWHRAGAPDGMFDAGEPIEMASEDEERIACDVLHALCTLDGHEYPREEGWRYYDFISRWWGTAAIAWRAGMPVEDVDAALCTAWDSQIVDYARGQWRTPSKLRSEGDPHDDAAERLERARRTHARWMAQTSGRQLSLFGDVA